MAIYRCEAKIIGREKRGHSVVAASAYRSGGKLHDDRNEKTHDYTRRSKGVVASTVIAPDHAPEWALDPVRLWNEIERGEKRVDAQLAREFVLAVPPELSKEDQFRLVSGWAQRELVGSGMVVEASLHHSKTGRNPHAHVLCTMRKLDGDRFGSKKVREWNDVKWLVERRESWAEAVNTALEQAGRSERVDHRSLQDQGIDRLPQPKIGPEAMALKRKGLVEDPERCKAVREVKMLNELRPMQRAIQKRGEIAQRGGGKRWWEKSIVFMSRAKTAVKNQWQKIIDAKRQKEERHGPDR